MMKYSRCIRFFSKKIDDSRRRKFGIEECLRKMGKIEMEKVPDREVFEKGKVGDRESSIIVYINIQKGGIFWSSISIILLEMRIF